MVQKYGENYGNMIANNNIDIGMTEEMLVQSWGRPPKIDGKVLKENYQKINYHYRKYPNKAGYKFRVVLENDKITEIRED